ncbi:MAG TPA: MFS transporter, partial [Elusimicrobiales bacterium]|nr:MFS transporter [Elusimicrobiales bacterium]
LLAARVLQGLGSALFFGTSVAILTAVTPRESRGRALGWVAASVYTGLTAGPFLGGLLSAALGWRAVFWANVPLGLVVLFLAARLSAEWKGPEGEKLDLPSSALYAVSIVLLMLGFSGGLKVWSAPLAAAGSAGLWYFMKREARAAHPVFHSELLFDNPVYAWSSFTALLNYSASFAVGFILSLYLQYVRGLSPVQAGLLLAVQPVFMAAFSPLAGRLSDRRDPGELASAGMGVTAAGILMFVIAGQSTPVPYLALALAVLGFGLALFSSPNTNAAMSAVEPRRYSVAYAALSTMRLTGQMFSMALVLLIFSMVLGKTRLGPGDAVGLLTSMRLAVVLFSVMAAAGIFTSLRRRRAVPARA